MNNRINWERAVIDEIAQILDCPNSDAQGIFEGQPFERLRQWVAEVNAKDAARAIVGAATNK